jgi:hypothetical protein
MRLGTAIRCLWTSCRRPASSKHSGFRTTGLVAQVGWALDPRTRSRQARAAERRQASLRLVTCACSSPFRYGSSKYAQKAKSDCPINRLETTAGGADSSSPSVSAGQSCPVKRRSLSCRGAALVPTCSCMGQLAASMDNYAEHVAVAARACPGRFRLCGWAERPTRREIRATCTDRKCQSCAKWDRYDPSAPRTTRTLIRLRLRKIQPKCRVFR